MKKQYALKWDAVNYEDILSISKSALYIIKME